MMRQVHAAPHPRLANALRDYGQLLLRAGRLDSAAATLERSLTMTRQVRPPDHPDVHTAMLRLGTVRGRQGNARAADALARAMLDSVGNDHTSTVRTGQALQLLADVARQRGTPDRADSLSGAAIRAYRAADPNARWRTAVVHVHQSRGRMERGNYPSAESLLVRAYDQLCRERGMPDHYTQQARRDLVSLYDAWEQPETADEYRRPQEERACSPESL
jgi:tetratricopeptide (TPR) repeat protein